MLEELNDNLQNADGIVSNDATQQSEVVAAIEQQVEESEIETVSEEIEETINDTQLEHKVEIEVAQLVSENSSELVIEEALGPNLEDKIIESSDLFVEDTKEVVLNSTDEIESEIEIEIETETNDEKSKMIDYDSLSMESLVAELEILVATEKIVEVKNNIEEIKKSFLFQCKGLFEESKKAFFEENPETTEEFSFHLPIKKQFDQLYSSFRDKKNAHLKNLQNNLQSNLENRLALVEELKDILKTQDNIKDSLKVFNDIRERWNNAGPIPKDKYNHVWNNYHFHVENFYDYLHLDREARDQDFKHNLEQKQKIVARVQELVNELDLNKAFRELQGLHKIWKEDIGPVSREYRDEIWNTFSDYTKQIHDKRDLLFEKLRASEVENLEVKKEIIAKLEVLATENVEAHSQWAVQIEKVETLRSEFFATGKVPAEVNEQTWDAFKTAVRNFNVFKNSFYKDIKKEQNDNLNLKLALVAKAKELQESTDFAATTPIMKQIQEEWKQIGHVPRKFSDKIWAEFRSSCNQYFDKLKASKSEENVDEVEAFEKKKAYLEVVKDFEMTGDHKTDLDAIKLHIANWKSFGKVPFNRRHIEGKFNKILDVLFEQLSLNKKDSEMVRFSNKLDQLSENNDTQKLQGEKIYTQRKIEEIRSEIFQLENNIQFFANTKNAKKENSIVLEVRKNIEKLKEEMQILTEKLKQIKKINQE